MASSWLSAVHQWSVEQKFSKFERQSRLPFQEAIRSATFPRLYIVMSTQGGLAGKGRSRPTRQAAAQHRYADMKVESMGYGYEDQVSI